MAILFLLMAPVLSMTDVQPDSLTITVENIRSNDGLLKVCVFDNEADFMQQPVICEDVTDFSKPEHDLSFPIPLDRRYAVIVYHDLNANGKLDRNILGIPSEPYGFSNNPSTRFGPSGFDKASFDASKLNNIVIRL